MIFDKLYNLKSFQRQYLAVLQVSVANTIPDLIYSISREELLEQIDWNNLLGISSVFCSSQEHLHLDAALRIAQSCLSLSDNYTQKVAAAVILENLTNHPAIRLAIGRNILEQNYKEKLPFTFQLQTAKTTFENSEFIAGELLKLNRFQKKVFESYETSKAVSISAPTSAGKSYILNSLVIDFLFKKNGKIIYIVPTRALISQVEEDIKNLLKSHNLLHVNVSTVPQIDDISGSHIFVFTQERLHWFLIEHGEVELDMIIIDEAQKIEDGNRGILLQQKIEEVIESNPSIKIFFSSPFTSNPGILLETIGTDSNEKIVDTQFVSVNQNLIYVKQVPRKVDEYKVQLVTLNQNIDLGLVKLRDRPGSGDFKKLCLVCEALSSSSGGTLVYSNGAAEAEKIALIFSSFMAEVSSNEELDNFIALVKKTIHKKYALATVLNRGIAFHYGNMPLLIRQEIERLFKNGTIKVLICTSTLLEGVNLPAKNIFIRKPTRGRNNPLSSTDFWNLAGRAGRWGKEFSGNIICVDPSSWEVQPNPNKTKQVIKRATDIIKSQPDELFAYIEAGSPRQIAEKRQDLEFAFGYYYNKFLANGLDSSIKFDNTLIKLFAPLKDKILIPAIIIGRNPGISPLAQQALFEFFSTKSDNLEDLIPVYPEDENAYNEYINLIGRIGKTIAEYPPALTTSRALLIINWMQGRPLSYIISSSYASYQKNDKYKKIKTLPIVIRECMDNVENFARFRFAKDSSCYIDILRFFLGQTSKSYLIEKIPELNLWLEFGVSQKTHLSLLSLGLTRSTVTEISDYIPSSNMNKKEALNWLNTFDFSAIEISPIVYNDIKKTL